MRANDVINNFCRGIKYFRGGPYISNIFVPGVQIFRYIWTGGNQNRGVQTFRDTTIRYQPSYAPINIMPGYTTDTG